MNHWCIVCIQGTSRHVYGQLCTVKHTCGLYTWLNLTLSLSLTLKFDHQTLIDEHFGAFTHKARRAMCVAWFIKSNPNPKLNPNV